jgi:signal transduction histidine kinase
MYRLELLMQMLHRLEVVRTGQLPVLAARQRKRIRLADFIEDFLEALDEESPFDPIHGEAVRERLSLNIHSSLAVAAAPEYLTNALKDILRNAVMYSTKRSPIIMRAERLVPSEVVQLDIIDQGIGIRPKEADRVFAPFQRARQPKVLAEFGFGLSLYLVKAEVDAMGGRIWYESEEGVGSTFSLKLPGWSG